MGPDPVPIDTKLIPPTRLEKANWESTNEGVQERVNFDDTIWGFDLSGGIKYQAPIRVTRVKYDSRAQKAGIRAGDKVLKINDIPTETLTLQEAHALIIESGIHIRLSVTAPEDTETSYHYWQDLPDPIEERKKLIRTEPKPKKLVKKTRGQWELAWPWIVTQQPLYRESNCHVVPSKFISKNGEKLLPAYDPDIVIRHPFILKQNLYEFDDEGYCARKTCDLMYIFSQAV